MVIMESLALGRPVIASWVAGVPELVRDGHTGWLVPPGDATALANAMKACLALQPTQMAAMANAGKTSVRKAHDARIEAQKLMVLLTPTNGAETAVPSARPATPL